MQPVQVLKTHSPKGASKSFHTTHGCQKSRFAPNAPDRLCAKGTRHLIRLPEMVALKDPLTLDIGYLSSLGSSFVIEIQAHARKIGLERIR